MAYGGGWASLLLPVAVPLSDSAVCLSKKQPFKEAFSPLTATGGYYSLSQSRKRELLLDLVKGMALLGQVLSSTWWEGTNGSSLLFGQWDGIEQIWAVRDGMSIHVQGSLSQVKRGKAIRFDPLVKALVAIKLQTMID
jgi:hypothetical protein